MTVTENMEEKVFSTRELNDKFFDHPHYKWNKIIMKTYGLWPYQDFRVRASILFFIVVISSMTVVAPEIVLLFKIFNKLGEMAELLTGFLSTYMVFVVIFYYATHVHEFRAVVDQMKSNKNALTDENELETFNKYAEVAKLWTVGYAILIGTIIVTLPLGPLSPIILDLIIPLNESRPLQLLIPADYGVDMQKKTNFLLILAHQSQAGVTNLGVGIAYDTYYIMVMHHACSLFAILVCKIKAIDQLNTDLFNTTSNQERDKLLLQKVGECVRYHLNITRFFDAIENSMHLCWFLQVFSNMLLISIVGVQMMFRSHSDDKNLMLIISSVMFITGALFRLYWICWPAQKLLDHSSDVLDHLYGVSWYQFPVKSRKAVLFMMLNSSPCQLTAGKVILLNSESFSRLANMSYTYFTMLLSFQ